MNMKALRLVSPWVALSMALATAVWMGAAQAQDGPVSGQEIQQTWSGKELQGTSLQGARVFLKLETDGKASFSVGNISDTGTWRIHDQGYCTTWQRVRAGEERCFTVIRSGGRFNVFNPDGSVSGTWHHMR